MMNVIFPKMFFRNSTTMRTVISRKDVGFLRKPAAISGNLKCFREGDACAFSESTNISRKDGARTRFANKNDTSRIRTRILWLERRMSRPLSHAAVTTSQSLRSLVVLFQVRGGSASWKAVMFLGNEASCVPQIMKFFVGLALFRNTCRFRESPQVWLVIYSER